MGDVRTQRWGAEWEKKVVHPLGLRKELMKGQQPWTDEEDELLKETYPRLYCIRARVLAGGRYAEHPLFAELLTAELPEESRRTVVQVRRRLRELGLTAVRGAVACAHASNVRSQALSQLDPCLAKS